MFSSRRAAALLLLLLFFLACLPGCDLLQTRDAENPSRGGSTFVPPTSPDLVISNLQAAVREKNPQNYRRCLVDPGFTDKEYTFVPSVEAAAQHAGIFAEWSLAAEEQYFRNLATSRAGGIASLHLFDIDSTFIAVDEVLFSAKYHLIFQHQNSSIAEEARGNLQFAIASDQRSWWHIYRWIDSRDTSSVTWSDLKAVFR